MSDPTEEAIEAIKAMGLSHDEDHIREALRRCNNNPQEAVQLLLPESPTSETDMNLLEGYRDIPPPHYGQQDSRDSYDVDMRDTETHPSPGGDSDRDSTTVSYSLEEDNMQDIDEDIQDRHRDVGGGVRERGEEGGEEYRPGSEGSRRHEDQYHVYGQRVGPRHDGPPPRYEDIVDDNQRDLESTTPPPPLRDHHDDKLPTPTPQEMGVADGGDITSSSSIEFPLTHYYELEGRVHTEQWSIPYKREESLAICMVATTRMILEGPGLAEGDENCKKFMDKTLPDAFFKLVKHEAVFRWDQSIMEGILDMCRILVELIAERLKQQPIPTNLLNLLAMVFNADANYHTKMKNKRTDAGRWNRLLGEGKVFALMPHFQTHKDPKGWLVEIMNVFAQHGGIEAFKNAVETEEITLQELTALFQPFSVCEDYINPTFLKAEFSKPILRAIRFIHNLSDESLKDKEVGCVSDLLKALKTLLLRCSIRDLAATVDNLRLDITIRMLKTPHFNAKMNALKEVVRLTEEPYQAASRGVRSPIPADRVTDWLVQEKVLSIALQGNLHQSQYCEKIKSILEFLGQKLSMEELTTMWEMQVDKNPVQIENVHGLIAAAASRTSSAHLDHLFQLIRKSWEESVTDRYREKLLELIGKIGKDDRQGKTASKILEVLWSLAHLPNMSREMVELALESHSTVLIDSYHTKDAEKKTYISKCVEDIKKGQWVVSAFRQLHRLAKGFCRTGYQKDEHQVAELQRQHDLIRQSCTSLLKTHAKAVQYCKQNQETLSGDTVVDGMYTHRETMEVHLQFLAFLLQDGALYMPSKRAGEVWDTLISNPNACQDDRALAFKWFDVGMSDLEHDTQVCMFNAYVLKVDPLKLDSAGYRCLRNFFETINIMERKLKRLSASYTSLLVESQELTGLDYLWRAALEVKDTKIADELIQNILQVSYQGLSVKIKKDIRSVHMRFIDECFRRLGDLMKPAVEGGESGSSRTSTGRIVNPELRLQAIERLLLLAQRYISVVEEHHHYHPRSQPPHGACFQGHHMVITVTPDQQKPEFKLECHSNESLLSIKHKIARRLNVSVDHVTMGISDRWLDSTDTNKLIHQLEFGGPMVLIIKTYGGSVAGSGYHSSRTGETAEGNAQRQALAHEHERNLPGVILASRKEFFIKLEELCALGSPSIIRGVRNLLLLVPTDPRIAHAIEVFAPQEVGGGASEDSSSQDGSSPSPQTVLDELFSASETTPTQLLYNLEVLSGRLIPIPPVPLHDPQKETSSASSLQFRRSFLEHGGLKAVINVLQRDALPSHVDLTIRQDCYAIALTLARFLLCNQAMLPPIPRVPFRQHSSASQSSTGPPALSGGSEDSVDVPMGAGQEEGITFSVEGTGKDSAGAVGTLNKATSMEDEAARLTIETMSVADFSTTLAHLIRVCWAAAAGQLHLASLAPSDSPHPSPSPSPSSSSSHEQDTPPASAQLRAGICIQQEHGAVSSKNAAIARESLELLTACLKLRSSLLNAFYTLPQVDVFVCDILMGCPHPDVRLSMDTQLTQLCRDIDAMASHSSPPDTNPVKRLKTATVESPRHFFLSLLLNQRGCLWEHRPQGRPQLTQWERSVEYFDLLCSLLQETKAHEQESLGVDIVKLAHEEFSWLKEASSSLSPSSSTSSSASSSPFPSAANALQTLLAGHLQFCRILFSFQREELVPLGRSLASQLLCDFLFPASKMILESDEPRQPGIININPLCSDVSSRVAAYDLLVELCIDNYATYSMVAKQLVTMHHKPDPQIAKEWEFQPPVIGRSACGFVGLKNAGATCYMNSVLQQLYMTPPIREVILSSETDQEDETILPELQCVFGHLMQSKLQYYSPETFWKKFKLWGQPVNVREQQDAFEFFSNLTDQVDEQLKKKSYPKVFEKIFGGAFLDQKICRGCDHTYDGEESFLSLSLPVKSKTLEESLKEFVKGDWLEGDNAYFCEKCGEKRDTLKRTCIKRLPPVLMVHLKRFDYDWEANRAIKYDDFFEFPWMLDMEPYTSDGISRQERDVEGEEGQPRLYELVGIVVHSGQASAGHYYSFIKEKSRLLEGVTPSVSSFTSEDPTVSTSNPTPSSSTITIRGEGRGRWLKFNDVSVDEFTLTDMAVEAECFGGTYKAKGNEGHGSHGSENRTRYWNAYMLFYEEVKDAGAGAGGGDKVGLAPPIAGTGPHPISPTSPLPESGDKLTQLQALVQKGEKHHMFSDSIPAAIQRSVNEENLQFMQHRDVYCPEYLEFIYRLTLANTGVFSDLRHPEQAAFGVVSIHLATNFFFHTYFRTRKKLRVDLEQWVQVVQRLLSSCKEACAWLVELLASPEGTGYLKPFLLECTNREVRQAFCRILSTAVQMYISQGRGPPAEGPVSVVVDCLLQMLDKDVIDNSKTCAEYFEFFKNYAGHPQGCRHLLEKDTFVLLVDFLLGPSPKPQLEADSTHQEKALPRRWSSNQVKEFGPLHSTLSQLVRNTDISCFESDNDSGEEVGLNPYAIPAKQVDLVPPSDGMHQALFTIDASKRFIRESVLTLRESDMVASDAIASTFCYCCWNNQSFSACTIEDMQQQVAQVPSNEIRNYFKVLTELLLINDCLQQKRISFAISGGKYKPHISILQTIQANSSTGKSDSKKTYQGIKFLVGLANKCKVARDFLLSHAGDWQWTVSWLRRKMSDHYAWSSGSMSNESSSTRIFQRTVSAQDTLEEANALLSELEARDSKQQQQHSSSGGGVAQDKLDVVGDVDPSSPHPSITQIEG